MILHQARPRQGDIAAALLDPSREAPRGLVAWNGSDIGVRLNIYRNNVIVSLVDALADTFPVVRRLVGDEFFRAAAAVFVRAQPPRSPVLAEYGDGFAAWLEGFEPTAALPYLGDMARLERARVRAWHAAEALSLSPQALAPHLAAPEQLALSCLYLQPSIAVIASDWAVASLWAAHQRDDDDHVAAVAIHRAESALVLREHDDVLVLPVARSIAVFVQALGQGQTLAAAIEAATMVVADDAPFDFVTALSLLIRHGAITHWQTPGGPE